ncbi:hypothetical protein NL676_004961 [Syzygium grande]|nr:hypothetical protein NL676_004961 [Syzygium grande]
MYAPAKQPQFPDAQEMARGVVSFSLLHLALIVLHLQMEKDELETHSKPESISIFVHYGGERTNDPSVFSGYDVVLTAFGVLTAACKHGLDPRATSDLFSNSVCIGEKAINDEDCFVLKLEAEPSTLRARSSSNVEIIWHTLWGYFSQRTGLLVQLEDSYLLRIKSLSAESVFWETTMESPIQDYWTIDSINIAHASVSLFRFGENSESHSMMRMEEVRAIEEVDFNIKGLLMDCFLPPLVELYEDERFESRRLGHNR